MCGISQSDAWRQSAYSALKPANIQPLRASDFKGIKHLGGSELTELKSMRAFHAVKAGISCDDVCAEQAYKCAKHLFHVVNNCNELKKAFDCDKCEENYGFEQPAFVVRTAPSESVRQRFCAVDKADHCALRACAAARTLSLHIAARGIRMRKIARAHAAVMSVRKDIGIPQAVCKAALTT